MRTIELSLRGCVSRTSSMRSVSCFGVRVLQVKKCLPYAFSIFPSVDMGPHTAGAHSITLAAEKVYPYVPFSFQSNVKYMRSGTQACMCNCPMPLRWRRTKATPYSGTQSARVRCRRHFSPGHRAWPSVYTCCCTSWGSRWLDLVG